MGRTPVRQPGQSICVIRSEAGKFFLQDVNFQDGLGPGGMTGPVVKIAPPAGLIVEHTLVVASPDLCFAACSSSTFLRQRLLLWSPEHTVG